MKFRALEGRTLPPLRRSVDADEVFDVPHDGELQDYALGLLDQPYFECVEPKVAEALIAEREKAAKAAAAAEKRAAKKAGSTDTNDED